MRNIRRKLKQAEFSVIHTVHDHPYSMIRDTLWYTHFHFHH